jgi:hypothetical protein
MFDSPSQNHRQEQTGQKGSLPDADYNLHCKALGGPDWKLNYFKSSCAIRLEDHTCKTSTCPRYVGKPQKKAAANPVIVKKNGRPKTNADQVCVCCNGETRTRTGKKPVMKAHKLCSICYSFHHHKGTMDQWRQEAKT